MTSHPQRAYCGMSYFQIGTIYPCFSYLGFELSLIAATRGISGHHVYLKKVSLFMSCAWQTSPCDLRKGTSESCSTESIGMGAVLGHAWCPSTDLFYVARHYLYFYQNEFTK